MQLMFMHQVNRVLDPVVEKNIIVIYLCAEELLMNLITVVVQSKDCRSHQSKVDLN